MKSAELFGIPILTGKREELLDASRALLSRGGTLATVNATMLERARTNRHFHKTLREMTLCIPDGVGVARAFGRQGIACETLPGVELGLLLLLAKPCLRLALYGAKEGVAGRAAEKILSLAPECDIVLVRDGYHHTPFEVIRDLVPKDPDLVYICLGSPKQEEVAKLVSDACPRATVIGLGGSFDVWSGDVSRAPRQISDMGLEWLYRMTKEPKRFLELPTLVSFTFHTLFIKNRTNSPKSVRKNVKTKK